MPHIAFRYIFFFAFAVVIHSPVDFKLAGQIIDDDILKILVKPMREGGKFMGNVDS